MRPASGPRWDQTGHRSVYRALVIIVCLQRWASPGMVADVVQACQQRILIPLDMWIVVRYFSIAVPSFATTSGHSAAMASANPTRTVFGL